MWMKKLLFFLGFPFFLNGQVAAVIESWKNNPALKNASISYCVLDANNGENITSYNAHLAMIPASTLKILSTAAALSILGPEFKYETSIYFSGNFDKTSGVLTGDLILSGSGDPSLQSEHFYKETELLVTEWAKTLKQKGLKEIKGKIIADASYMERKVPDNWIWEDISNYYGAVPNAISYCDNKFKVIYASKEKQSEAKIIGMKPTYLTQSITISSQVTASGTKDEAYAYGDPFSFTKEIRGSIPANKTSYEIEVALPDPALLCAEQLYLALQAEGIKCQEKSIFSNYSKSETNNKKQLMLSHFSPTLDKLVYFTNQNSDNLYCESLLYTLGNGSAEKGLQRVKNYWQQQKLDTSEIYMEDASGLGRINTVTSDFQAKALVAIARDKTIFQSFKASLPIAGKQGSMTNLGKGTVIENNLRAKTGYMKRVRAYCGYVKGKSGKELAFSLLFNNYNCSASEAKKQMEKFLIALGEL